MRRAKSKKGFTLVELMVALIVTGIILSAIATLAFAFSTVNDATDDTDRKQAELRYATLKISELIRHCKLICGIPGNDLVIWKADDNPDDPNNGEIDISELVYIDTGSSRNQIEILEFLSSPVWLSRWFRDLLNPISYLQSSLFKQWLKAYCTKREVAVIPECDNVRFRLDNEAEPPRSRFVNISFDLAENGTVRQYHIDSTLRCWAGHLLNETGTGLKSDDD